MFAEALVGQTVSTEDHGNWQLLAILGGGWFSTVYEAVEAIDPPSAQGLPRGEVTVGSQAAGAV